MGTGLRLSPWLSRTSLQPLLTSHQPTRYTAASLKFKQLIHVDVRGFPQRVK